MVNCMSSSVGSFRAIGLPFMSFTVKSTTGFSPARWLVTPVMVTLMLVMSVSGFCGYEAAVALAATCAPLMGGVSGGRQAQIALGCVAGVSNPVGALVWKTY